MNKINIQRDKQGQPIKIESELMGTYQHSIGGMSQPRLISNKKNVLRKKYLLTYENNGACNVSRIISNDSVILFDDALCAELSSMLSKFSETEANRIITQMTSVVANFKKKIESEGLRLPWMSLDNSSRDVVSLAVDCSNFLNSKKDNETQTPSSRRPIKRRSNSK